MLDFWGVCPGSNESDGAFAAHQLPQQPTSALTMGPVKSSLLLMRSKSSWRGAKMVGKKHPPQ